MPAVGRRSRCPWTAAYQFGPSWRRDGHGDGGRAGARGVRNGTGSSRVLRERGGRRAQRNRPEGFGGGTPGAADMIPCFCRLRPPGKNRSRPVRVAGSAIRPAAHWCDGPGTRFPATAPTPTPEAPAPAPDAESAGQGDESRRGSSPVIARHFARQVAPGRRIRSRRRPAPAVRPGQQGVGPRRVESQGFLATVLRGLADPRRRSASPGSAEAPARSCAAARPGSRRGELEAARPRRPGWLRVRTR